MLAYNATVLVLRSTQTEAQHGAEIRGPPLKAKSVSNLQFCQPCPSIVVHHTVKMSPLSLSAAVSRREASEP